MNEEKKAHLEALSDEDMEAVTGGDANYTYPCSQCGQIAWVETGTRPSPNFTGKPGGSYITSYRCGNCMRLKEQGLVDEVPTLDV